MSTRISFQSSHQKNQASSRRKGETLRKHRFLTKQSSFIAGVALVAAIQGMPALAANTITFDTVTATFPTVNTFLPISAQVLTFTGPTASRTITLPNTDFTVTSLAGTETLTNKTLTQPTLTLKQSAGAAPTASGDLQYDTTSKRIKVGNGTSTDTVLGTGTLTDTKICTYDATNVQIVCNTTGSGGGGDALVANPLSQFAATTSAQLRGVLSDESGTGLAYFQGGDIGTPSAGVMTNATGLPVSTGISGLASGIATFLTTPSSANLRAALTDEVGTGAFYAVGGALGTPASGTATNLTGLPISTGLMGAGTGVLTALGAAANAAGGVAIVDGTKTLTNTTYDAEGTGNTLTLPTKVWLPAAGCSNATAASFWDLPTVTPAVSACVTGTNIQKGVLQFADTSGGFSAQNTLLLPADFSGNIDARIIWRTAATTGNAKFSLSTKCTDVAASATDDPAFNTASTVTTAAPGTTLRIQTSSITGVTTTGCSAGNLLHVKLFRDGNDAADTISASLDAIGVELTIRRAM